MSKIDKDEITSQKTIQPINEDASLFTDQHKEEISISTFESQKIQYNKEAKEMNNIQISWKNYWDNYEDYNIKERHLLNLETVL